LIYGKLGICYGKMNDIDKEIEYYNKELGIYEKFPDALNN